MAKIYNIYSNGVDKTWYKSSNIIYSECQDIENDYKILDIVFKNGRTYRYTKVDVRNYLMFREAPSQGKAFSTYMKSYDTKRIDDRNIEELQAELTALQNPEDDDSFSAVVRDNCLTISQGKEVVYKIENFLQVSTIDLLSDIFKALNVKATFDLTSTTND